MKKTELARDPQGHPVLYLFLDYERAWATLGQALDNAQVDVTSLDRETGLFVVNISDRVFSGEEEGSGFLCRFTFSCGDDDSVDLQIIVRGDDQAYEVSVLDVDGQPPADAELAQQVLVLIREYAA